MHRFPRAALALVPCLALAACAATASPERTAAAAAAPPASPPLSSALGSYAFYLGHWECDGTSYEEDGRAAETWKATIDVAPELDGSWLSVQMKGPGDNRTIEHKGYDASDKRWIHLAVTAGGGWGLMVAPGWTGQQMTFTPADRPDGTHATFTKVSDTEYTHAVTKDSDKGPLKVWEKRCVKPPTR